MRKIISLILFMTLVFTCPVFGAEQTAQATLTYTCDDSFFIEIPETIAVGEECSISVVEANISPTKAIYVDLMNNPDEYVQLYNEYDNSEYIDAYFRNSEGNVLSVVDMNLATFQYGENTNKTFTTFVRDTSGKKAGAYSGTAVFYIHCD